MQRALSAGVAAGCLLALSLACFGPVLLHDQQFSYRDSGEFYYPLHRRVQQEWEAGRWPLWEPEENGGMPLLGNPSAAVLYPGKVVFILPYAWGARLYVVAHVLLASAAMMVLLRSWQVSWTGSGLGAIAYSFGGPVLFQFSNVIYLVGAAWAPLGLRAVDRLVRLRRRGAAVELAVVLALQVLGGDPEAAYLVVLFGGLYALGLAWSEGHEPRAEEDPRSSRSKARWIGLGILLVPFAWVAITLSAAAFIKTNRAWFPFKYQAPYPAWYQLVLLAGWSIAAALLLARWRGRPGTRGLVRSVAALVGSSMLALGLGAAQVLPVLESSRLSVRAAGDGPHDIYPFSVEPFRAVEWIWPGFFGSFKHGERNWLHLVPPTHNMSGTWTPSLYLGGLTLVLVLGTNRLWGGPPWRVWLMAIALVSFLGAVGEFGGPVWWARAIPGVREALGAHDPRTDQPIRSDGGVADGDGSVYWLLATVLPWFQSFRYPGKLLTFTTLGLAALAGSGWDRGREGRSTLAPAAVLGLSLGLLAIVAGSHDRLARVSGAEGNQDPSIFGPFDANGAVADLRRALGQGAIAVASGLAVAAAGRRRYRWAGPAAVVMLTADLAVANAPLVITAPQAMFDQEPELARVIKEAEQRDPSPGPFRVHRMPPWFPGGWYKTHAADRYVEITRWEYDTIKHKYALLGHLSYTLTGGSLELNDYASFFGGFYTVLDTRRAPLRGARHGQRVLYYTRRGYDLWNTRYFILPMDPAGWQGGSRGFAAFLDNGEVIAPDPSLTSHPEDPKNREKLEAWVQDRDWQLVRNKAAYPRAWVVHQARLLRPMQGAVGRERERIMEQILFADDVLWFDPNRRVFDPRAVAWIETDDPGTLRPYLPGTEPDPTETVAIRRYEPQRVEIEARLKRPGLVILADVNHPGWTLTIDGQPATILRANRLMRGAAVAAGTHLLVYTYSPLSFRLGGLISLASLGFVLVLGVRARRKRSEDEAGGWRAIDRFRSRC
jgi:hypothetical protein